MVAYALHFHPDFPFTLSSAAAIKITYCVGFNAVPAAMSSRQTPLQGLMFGPCSISQLHLRLFRFFTLQLHLLCSSFQGVAFDQPGFLRIYDIKLRREELTNEDISFFVFKSQLSHKYNTWVTTKLDSYRILPNHHKRILYYIRI